MRVREVVAGAVALLLSVGCSQGGGGGSASAAAGIAPAPSAAVTVTGQVSGEEGPVAGVFLIVGAPGGDEGPELDPASLQTAEDGTFALALPAGRWELTAIDPEGRSARADVDVSDPAAPLALGLTLTAFDEQSLVDLIERGPGALVETSEEATR